MAISKITNAERDEVKIYGLPDKPGLSKEAMQQRFDGLGNLAIDKINEVIDSVNDSAKEVKELGDKVDQFGEGQIPEEYLQQSVDNYIANNQSGLATKTDVTNLDSKLSSEIAGVDERIGDRFYTPYKSFTDYTTTNNVFYLVSRADGTLIRQEEGENSSFMSTVMDCKPHEKYKLSFRHTSLLDNVIITDVNNVILDSYYTRDNTTSITVNDFEVEMPENAKTMYLSTSKAVGFVIEKADIQSVYDVVKNVRQVVVVDKSGNGDFTKLSEAINSANENTEIIVKSGVYDILEELGESYLDSYDGSTYGILIPKNSKLKFCAGAKVICNYNGTNNAIKEFFSPINSNRGSVEYEDIVIEASNVKYCIHDEHGGELEPYTTTFNRCNLYLDDSQNELAYSKSCIGGGLGKYGTIEVKNGIFESVGTQIGGTVSYHTSADISDAVCHVNIHNNYFVGSDDTARVYSAYTGNGTQTTFVSVNNNSLGKAYMTDDKVVSKYFLNEVRS